jgi:hypothetical protein
MMIQLFDRYLAVARDRKRPALASASKHLPS